MTVLVFGDDAGADDAYNVDGDPDPDQVARRLHELRQAVEELIGAGLDDWDALDPPEQALSLAIGGVIVDWLAATDPDNPEAAAHRLHDVRRYWSGGRLDPWDQLDPERRQIGVDLMALLIGWLQREGTL